jgi:hypothetical protein
MATQMKDMAATSRDLERSKIEVQLKLFTEQMSYQRDKDRRLYENAMIANENARLAIMKQGEVVSCLEKLSTVLRMGLNVKSPSDNQGSPQPTPTDEASQQATTSTAEGTTRHPTCVAPSATMATEGAPSTQ